ncbi:mitochondrial outer membrane translocase complex, subunit Tom5 [Talaromyces proteolyticus]|uniref:Mitochondrial outer membrane translocase complex, subunit Tom5 n=1 Tax=Talaromyces proteolyticus TaxID=1131652 RepID=A0AAD4KYT7_9EURO|nr:mitochondrial outer membrane translocase complex, subunit Tom5 [Talaromyces proteolyticus]KAH8704036.1 mitochondrial outer membrane translocase complex, subunit Tom5 [Talaromyces proteolyticus]
MFGGGEQRLSKEEIEAGEIEAQQTVRFAVATGILLYLSPFAVDFVKKFL